MNGNYICFFGKHRKMQSPNSEHAKSNSPVQLLIKFIKIIYQRNFTFIKSSKTEILALNTLKTIAL